MKREEIRKTVETLVRRLYHSSLDEFLNEEPVLLGEDGFLDSVAALQLLLALEEAFGIIVKDEDIRPGNFKSVACLTRFVQQKLSSAE